MQKDDFYVRDLPLGATEYSAIEVPHHEAEKPHALRLLEDERPRRAVVTVPRDAGNTALAESAPPSMPSYQRALSPRPAVLRPSPPPRVRRGDRNLRPLAGIFPPDGRSLYTDTAFPWICVCIVTSGTKGGSGALIGPRHVLTASHVIDWRASGDSVSIVRGGTTLGSASSTHAISYKEIHDVTYDNADEDYAILVLDQRLGDSFGFLGARTYDAAWDDETSDWMNIAFSPDLSMTLPSFQTGFFIDEDDLDLGGGRTLTTDTGDFVNGMSGSPVFGNWPGGPFVVGVVSAATSGPFSDYNAIAGGNDLTRLVHKARAQFP